MPRDTQIFSGADHAGNSDYELPSDSEIRVLAVNANFEDNGAGADWCPAVIMFSDSGHVIARALDPGTTVTAGDDAEASFFPGVKPGAAAGVTGVASGLFWGSTNVGQVIPSGAVTALTFDVTTSVPGGFPPVAFSGSPAGSFTVTAWRVHIDLTVTFPAGAYDRYVEIAQVGQSAGEPLFTPVRKRSQVTPDGDTLTVSAVVVGSPFSPSPLQLNVFQASGANQTVQRFTSMYGWPIPLPSKVWS